MKRHQADALPHAPADGRALAGYVLTDTLVRHVHIWRAPGAAGFYFALTQANRNTKRNPGAAIFYGVYEPISWSMVLSEIEKLGDFDHWTEQAVDASLAEGELMDCRRAAMWQPPDGRPRRGWDDQPYALGEMPSVYETLNQRFRGEADRLAAMLDVLAPSDALVALLQNRAYHNQMSSTLLDKLGCPAWGELVTAMLERQGAPTIRNVETAVMYALSIWEPWQAAAATWAQIHGKTDLIRAYMDDSASSSPAGGSIH